METTARAWRSSFEPEVALLRRRRALLHCAQKLFSKVSGIFVSVNLDCVLNGRFQELLFRVCRKRQRCILYRWGRRDSRYNAWTLPILPAIGLSVGRFKRLQAYRSRDARANEARQKSTTAPTASFARSWAGANCGQWRKRYAPKSAFAFLIELGPKNRTRTLERLLLKPLSCQYAVVQALSRQPHFQALCTFWHVYATK